MMYKSLLIRLSWAVFFFSFSLISYSQPSPDAGKTLFRNYCAACHNRNMVSDMTGPALGGTQERWTDYPLEYLYSWIRGSQAMIAAGHPKAVELWNDYKPVIMNDNPSLSDDDIASLLLYIDGVYQGTYGVSATAAEGEAGTVEEAKSLTWIYLVILGLLILLAIVLTRVLNRMKYLNDLAAGKVGAGAKPATVWSSLTSKEVIGFVIFALVVLGGYFTVSSAIALNRQQDYQPDQPIKFSHVTHAGLHQIDCQYCHDGARRSKHSVIPATNTCMNCHKAIKNGSTYGTAELTKIYASIGFNPNTDQYIENYDELSEDEIKEIYTTWIANEYVAEAGVLDRKGERLVEDQWNGIVNSLTSETKEKIQGPVEWVRIHNLPDHVYFNHSQHVTVGKLECQQCHGKVEEMEVVKQYSTLSMGWCINCHRETEVQFTDNPYYVSYAKFHEEILEGSRDKVTVEEIGGLECQKCHY